MTLIGCPSGHAVWAIAGAASVAAAERRKVRRFIVFLLVQTDAAIYAGFAARGKAPGYRSRSVFHRGSQLSHNLNQTD